MASWRGFEDMPVEYAGRPRADDGERRDWIYDVSLYPSRPLSRKGFLIIMTTIGVVSALAGAYFLLRGAWPVTGFFGLDVIALYIAFKASYRSGRLHERVRVSRDEVSVRRVLPSGLEKRWRLKAPWVRVALERPVEHDSQLRLTCHGRSIVIGSFLPPEERGEIAAALQRALSTATVKEASGAV